MNMKLYIMILLNLLVHHLEGKEDPVISVVNETMASVYYGETFDIDPESINPNSEGGHIVPALFLDACCQALCPFCVHVSCVKISKMDTD